ncbi:hypothetical protein CLCR_00727 [Cladophialophora carrionii]|uniref:Uncharacterized protein n=1 Tax=Cladophialophora carrionii TaxID=86049 RepID=A0A1C1C6H5_9EURO|nr:hypothetical protein CLCR_00727 [Cladophialophora carrionii]
MVHPTALRMMQATRAGMFRATQRAPAQQKSGYVAHTTKTPVSSSNYTAVLEHQSADRSVYRVLVFRENRVPYYQRLFQNHDGKRQWWKVSRSPFIQLFALHEDKSMSLKMADCGTANSRLSTRLTSTSSPNLVMSA